MSNIVLDRGMYSFDASTKTITLNAYVDPATVTIITALPTNTLIYNWTDPLLGATITSNIMVLDYDTTSLTNFDDIVIRQTATDIAPKSSYLDSTIGVAWHNRTMRDFPAVTATSDFLVPPIDTRGMKTMTLEVTGTFSANLTLLEGMTGDLLTAITGVNGPYEKQTTIITGTGVFKIPVFTDFMAVQCTSYTSGTPKAVVNVSAAPFVWRTVSTTNESMLTVSSNVTIIADTRAGAIDVQNKRQILFLVNVTAVSGTGTPTLELYIDSTVDGSTPYYRLQAAALVSITATGQYAIGFTAPFGRFCSLFYKVTGTTPSFTFTTRASVKE